MQTIDPAPNSLRALFDAASDIADPRQRADYIAGACAGDADKLRRLNELLAAENKAGSFLREENVTRQDPLAQATGQRIGRYKLLQQIGEGGCGIVYMAEQEEPVRRKVALKIIKAGMDTKTVVARFEAERQALALMDHPNIAKFFDAGTATPTLPSVEPTPKPSPASIAPNSSSDTQLLNARPYFVMELVRGIRITEYCDQHHLDATARLHLFIQVCHAVQHAHQKGVIHRDLKPSNILVTVNDGVPVPKIIDFGIAKATEQRLTDRTLFTAFEQFLGTPAYMSPEQAAMTSLDIDTRSDIYSLGVLLYELLTSRTPFEHKDLLKRGIDDLRKTLREVDPPRPSTRISTLADADQTTIARSRGTDIPSLLSAVRGDLDWIVMKCLEKDRTRRYDTATGLARDVERYLANEPISARPPSKLYALQKFVRRNQAACAATAAIAVALVAALLYSSIAYSREHAARTETEAARLAEGAQRRLAEAESRRAERNANDARANVIRQYVANGNTAAGVGNAIEALPWFAAALELETDPRRIEMHQIRLATSLRQAPKPTHRFQHQAAVLDVAFSPDLRQIASASRDRTARVWDLDRNQPVTPPLSHPAEVFSAAFTRDGRRLLTRSANRTTTQSTDPDRGTGSVHVWEIASAQLLWQFHSSNVVWAAQFNPDDSLVAVACADNQALLLRGTDGSQVRSLPHPREVRHVAFSPDGRWLATNCRDNQVRVWEVTSGKLMQTQDLTGNLGWNWEEPRGAEFSRDSKHLLAFNLDKAALYDVATGKQLHNFHAWSQNSIQVAAISPDSVRVLTIGRDTVASVFDIENGKLTSTFRGIDHFSNVQNDFRGRFTPDGLWILTWNRHGVAVYSPDGIRVPIYLGVDHILDAEYSQDNRRIALATFDGNVRIWDLISDYEGAPAPETTYVHTRSRITPDGKRLLAASGDGELAFWDVATGEALLDDFPRHPPSRVGINWLETSPDGSRVVTMSRNGLARVFDTRTGEAITPFLNHPSTNAENNVTAQFTPRNDAVVSGDAEGVLRLWSIPEGKLVKERRAHPESINWVVSHSKASVIATVSSDHTARLWDPNSLLPLGEPLPLDGPGGHAAVSPDGKHFMVGCWNTGSLTLFRLPDGKLLHRFPSYGQNSIGGFSPEGTQYACAWADGYLRAWDIQSGRLTVSVQFAGSGILTGFSPNGKMLTLIGSAGLRLFDAVSGEPISPVLFGHATGRYMNGFAFTPDSRTLFGGGGGARIWNLQPLAYTPGQWQQLAAAFSGLRVSPDGQLTRLSAKEAEESLTQTQRTFPQHFTVPDLDLARWQWTQAQQSGTRTDWIRVANTIDRLIMQGQGSRFWRQRRAIARFTLGDLAGAAEDHPDFAIPPRDARATPAQIDLSRHYNRLLTKRGLGNPGVSLSELPRGLHKLAGTQFDLRGVVWLASKQTQSSGPNRPERINQIAVNQRGAQLHVLHASEYSGDSDGVEIGHYTLHYADGTTTNLSIVVGHDLRDWWAIKGESSTTTGATVAWTGNTPSAAANGIAIRLWKRTYPNPHPEKIIAAIDLVAAGKIPTPFLVAMTLE